MAVRSAIRTTQEVTLKKLLMALALLAAPTAAGTAVAVQPSLAATTISKLGDLSDMQKIVADTLALVEAGKTAEAELRIADYEKAWDANESKLRKLDTETWRKLDDMSDVALSTVRYPTSTTDEKKNDLSDLIRLLDNPML